MSELSVSERARVNTPTVLVIEDNPITRKVARLTLGNAGFNVLEAGTGGEALAMVPEKLPDLILQDLLLPDMDGLELIGRLRALPESESLPIIAFSGFLSRLEYGRAAAAGFSDFLAKPVEPSRLLQTVRAHLPEHVEVQGHVGEGRRLLIVDDDPVQLKLARLHFGRLGFECVTATDGVEALEILLRGNIDAVVSDVLMPRLDGFHLCLEIRKHPSLAELPVVLASSNYVEDADREVARRMGATSFALRTPDLAAVIDALSAATQAAASGKRPSVYPSASEHHDRVLRQLERQAALNAAYAHRSSMHASMLSAVAGISEALTHRHSIEDALPDILGSLLDASGVSRGALFLQPAQGLHDSDTAGAPALRASLGFSPPVAQALHEYCGVRSLFERVRAARVPIVLEVGGDEDARALLAGIEAQSGLLIPLVASEECLGVLLLASNARDLTERDWIPFARTMAVQVGQALALNRAFWNLAASEKRYRRMIETTNQGVWLIDVEGNTTFVNERMATMLGEEARNLVGLSPAEFLDDAGRAELEEHLKPRAGRFFKQSVVQMLPRDGSAFWALVESSVLYDASGQRDGAFAMVIDITEQRRADERRKLAEDALRASESQYRLLFESSPLPKWLHDEGTQRFLAVNDAAIRQYGYTREEFFEMRPGDLRVSEGSPGEFRPSLEIAGGSWNSSGAVSERHRTKKGTVIDVERTEHTFTRDDRPLRLAIVQDVTEHKRLEEQFRQSQKMEAVGRLAGGVAHDFNNVLSVILSYGELLFKELKPGEPMRDDVDEIRKAAKRAADLTRQLLMFSRQQVVAPKVLDLNDVLSGMDRMLQRILGADIDMVSLFAEGLGRVCVDVGSIEQVIMNLVVNARDAMPRGGKLTLETANVLLDEDYVRSHVGTRVGRHVMLAISDTGVGMDRATQARIFEPFFTTKDKDKGTGLGLSTVFGIVQQSGGSIWVYSEPGRGTTFKVHLPRVDAALDVGDASSTAPRRLDGTETILLVEDDDQVRLVARGILKRQGYRVIEARNAGEALLLSQATSGAIDLLLSDVVMPHMSGPELAERLAVDRPTMKILCMSGYTDDSIVRHGVLESNVAYLQKPLTPDSLATRVREVLETPSVYPSPISNRPPGKDSS
jgi:two-component system, cell cycle sensor histidine kinase and response regulator CckA